MTTVDLVPLHGGDIELTARFEFVPSGPLAPQRTLLAQALGVRRHWAPVPAFLLRHPTEGDVLVDTAYDPSVATDPAATVGAVSARIFAHRPNPLRPQLERLGAEPGTILMTHLHTDHASGLGQFPDATVVCDRVEWEAAHARGGWLNGYVRRVFDRIERKRLVDVRAGAPHGPFAHTHDVFGDGSVRMVSTPGHTPGHCSILLRTPEREVLLCADACGAERQLYEIVPSCVFVDRTAFLASLRAIQAWHRENPDGLAVPGHDRGWVSWLERGGG